MLRISQLGINLIKRYEGFSSKAYLCPAGVWTIGYGHTKSADLLRAKGLEISEEEGEELLKHDIKIFERAVRRLVKVDLTQNQFDALVSFTFNLGAGNLKKSTLLRKLNTGDYEGAAEEFPKWVRANGRILGGLVTRRKEERALFLTKKGNHNEKEKQ